MPELTPTLVILLLSFSLFTSREPQQFQGNTSRPDLHNIATGAGWKVFNRDVTAVDVSGKSGIYFNEKPGVGIAWLEGSNFVEGTIEVDLKGRDLLQKSFVGVAFRGVDENTHDVIYFRPFNFRSTDPMRRVHAVQYCSYPTFGWQRLRAERTGIYEKGIDPAPDPDAWLHARIVVAKRRISVFVNDSQQPSLVVDELSDRKGGLVGLWVGDESDGTFASLKITPAK